MGKAESESPKVKRRVDRLYTLPLEEFTRARNELARELRASGDRDAAERVKALRKPSRSAWAINRLRQDDRAVLRSALKSGQQLRAAQSGALSGASGEKLRDRARAERRAVAEAAERAAQIEPADERSRARGPRPPRGPGRRLGGSSQSSKSSGSGSGGNRAQKQTAGHKGGKKSS
jgi:hypothetical protein